MSNFERAVEEVLRHSLWFEDRQSLDWFFDGWVNGTAFPQFELSGVRIARGAKQATFQRDHRAEFSAIRLGDQRPGLWSGWRPADLSRPRFRRRR